MKPSIQLGLAATLGALACSEPPVAPTDPGGLVVRVLVGLHPAFDAGRIRLQGGQTDRTVNVTPGQTVTIDSLQPGTYTVALEGLAGGAVIMFGKRTDIPVIAGDTTEVTVLLESFVPTVGPLPTLDTVKTIRVGYTAVLNAVSYEIQTSTDSLFANSLDTNVSGTSADVTVPNYGRYYVQVRAKNEYASYGAWASAPQPIRLVSPSDLAKVVALCGDAFADTLVGSLSPGVRSAIRPAWDKCGPGTAALEMDTIQQSVDTVESIAAGNVADPTDRVLLDVMVLFVRRIKSLLGP